MTLNCLHHLFKDQLQDLYDAESQMVRVLPRLARSTHSVQLQNALESHLINSKEQIRRLERIADELHFKISGKVSQAMRGLIDESAGAIGESNHAAVHDAKLVAAALRMTAYEITAYALSSELAHVLGYQTAANHLGASLDEETAHDRTLSMIFKEAVTMAPLDEEAVRQCPDVVKQHERRDPLSGEHGAHAVGTIVGALIGVAMGAGTGAVLGGLGGPFGALFGAAAGGAFGAVAGGFAGKSVAEDFNPTIEHSYWRRTYAKPSVDRMEGYATYAPTYLYGWEAYGKHKDKQLRKVERQLEAGWNEVEVSASAWKRAKEAVQDSWERMAGR